MNNQDFDDLVKQNREYVYRYIYKQVKYDDFRAEEICQETFIKAYKFLKKNDVNVKTFRSWLCQIACNIIIDHHRTYTRKGFLSLEDIFEDEEQTKLLKSNFDISSVENSIYFNEEINNALSILKEKSYEIFQTFMTYLETDDYLQTSKIEDICIGTAKSRIFRARKILQENLPKDLIALIAD